MTIKRYFHVETSDLFVDIWPNLIFLGIGLKECNQHTGSKRQPSAYSKV